MKLTEYFVKKFWSKDNKPKDSIDNQIIFSMDPYSNPWIDIKINHINLQSSEAFAKLLFNLNTGQYKTSMIDCLINLSSNNTRLESTINNIVLIWEELLSEKIDHISENKPIISPKNTFTSSNK